MMFDDARIESHRQLTACTFANGTNGLKCVGLDACTGADESKIGCGSCYGTKSCFEPIGNVTIGENSCHDNVACMYLQGKCIDVSLHWRSAEPTSIQLISLTGFKQVMSVRIVASEEVL
jgi:hypothetical protein